MKKPAEIRVVDMLTDTGFEHREVKGVVNSVEHDIGATQQCPQALLVSDINLPDEDLAALELCRYCLSTLLTVVRQRDLRDFCVFGQGADSDAAHHARATKNDDMHGVSPF